jgi:twitching motility protein PilT
MIDNQAAAQLLFQHQFATQEQILEVWPYITSEKDVGMLLVERGVLQQQTYQELAAYLRTQSGPSGADGTQREIALEPAATPLSSIDPPEQDDSIFGFDDENWSAVPPDGEEPMARKSSRAEHARRKAEEAAAAAASATSQSAPVSAGIESTPPIRPESMPHSPAAMPSAAVPASPSAAPSKAARSPARKEANVSAGPASVPAAVGSESTWEELLAFARQFDAADLHLSAGNPILLRRYGALQAVTQAALDQNAMRKWVERALTAEQLAHFEEKGDLELIYTLQGWGRYRVTVLKQRHGWDVTARVVPSRIRTFEESGLPEACRELTKWAQGLVLVTGPVGCGKTSTLSTLVEMVNQERHDHVITIEEPIEILYEPAHCRITQRQIGPHTLSRDAALRAALREDPDIIVISELRDLDTIRLAVSAAETGHLVFGTMNTTNAGRTLYRLIDSFPPEEQGIVRNMISESLRGVISQQLVPLKDGSGMVPAYEVLLVNTAVANLIRKDEAHQLHTAMLTGKSSGMVLLDDSLRNLVERGYVDPAAAMARATVPKDFEKYLGRR